MKSKYLNHSSEKTRKIIRNAFSELIMEKQELSKITVTELVNRADINRGTFYNHYDDIYDVANDFEEEVLELFVEPSKELRNNNDVFLFFDDVIKYLKDNENIYRMILSSKEPLLFLERLNTLLQKNLYEYLSKSKDSKDLKINVSFYSNGVINQVLEYFKNNSDYSLDDLNIYMKKWYNLLFNAK